MISNELNCSLSSIHMLVVVNVLLIVIIVITISFHCIINTYYCLSRLKIESDKSQSFSCAIFLCCSVLNLLVALRIFVLRVFYTHAYSTHIGYNVLVWRASPSSQCEGAGPPD